MSVKNKTNKNYKRSQKGRSMVEMLGVLAIIGVLSVGGLYGYGVAMKKHKANELLHQASMLATTISAQAMTNDGNLPQTITSFGNSNYGTFSTTATEALDGKGFSIEISNMDSAVCTQMEKMAGGMVQGASCSGTTLTLTYYKNLATTEAEGEKSPTGGSGEGGDDTKCSMTKPGSCSVCLGYTEGNTNGDWYDSDSKCKTGEYCMNGQCLGNLCNCINGTCGGLTGEGVATSCSSDNDCTFNYQCQLEKTSTSCTNNSDCPNEKCGADGNNTVCYCKYGEGLVGAECGPNTNAGTCTKTQKTQKISNNTMDWFSARNYCQAIGSQLATFNWLSCSKDNNGGIWSVSDYRNNNGYGYCCTAGKVGEDIQSECVGGITGRSEKIPGNDSYWMNDLNEFYSAFVVNYDNYILVADSRNNLYHALCQ